MGTTAGALAKELAVKYGHQEYEVLAWLDSGPEAEIDEDVVEDIRTEYDKDHYRVELERS